MDDAHVLAQRSRYGHRREILRALTAPDEHVAAASERLERRGRR